MKLFQIINLTVILSFNLLNAQSIIGVWQTMNLDSAGFSKEESELIKFVRIQFQSDGTIHRIIEGKRTFDLRLYTGSYSITDDTIRINWIDPNNYSTRGIFSICGDTLTIRRIDQKGSIVKLFRIKTDQILVSQSSANRIQNKSELLCRKWIQSGLKPFKEDYSPVEQPRAFTLWIEFRKDGFYESSLSYMKWTGTWKFSNDSSKVIVSINQMNGKEFTIKENKSIDYFVKLTPDSLVYKKESYQGKYKFFGYDELYFVATK